MPIYEYRCDACENVFEEWRRHADDVTEAPCPVCEKTAHRLISNTSFVLKGGGWYVTEYGNRKTEGSTASGAGKSSSPSAPAATADAAPAPATPETPAASATTAAKTELAAAS